MNKAKNFLIDIRKYQMAPPVKVVNIAKDLGVYIYEAEEDTDLLSGKICKDPESGGPSGYAIYVNANHVRERKRFTIAHELAHFILHKDQIGDGIVENALYRSGLSNELEAEANKLAADVLMPWHLINIELDNTQNINELAKKFEVSQIAMAIRLGMPC